MSPRAPTQQDVERFWEERARRGLERGSRFHSEHTPYDLSLIERFCRDGLRVLDLGALDIGDSTTVTFTVSMPSNASDANQGATASASYQWVSTQVEPSSTTLTWR